MDSVTLFDASSRATAQIAPALGFNLHSLRLPALARLVEVLDCEPDFGQPLASPSRSGLPLLFPFPNRIRDARMVWRGREWTIGGTRRDPAGHAIHGFVLNRPWRVTRHERDLLIGEFQLGRDAPDVRDQWPADFLIEVAYHLDAGRLRCEVRILNPCRDPLPWGFGTHTYFRIPLADGGCPGDVLIEAPVTDLWELVDSLPTGRRTRPGPDLNLAAGVTLAGLKLDHVYGGLRGREGAIETSVLDPAAGLRVVQRFGDEFRELVAFTPTHGRSVCLEPYTCATDAANLQARGVDAGWDVLAPGDQRRLWFEIALEPLIA